MVSCVPQSAGTETRELAGRIIRRRTLPHFGWVFGQQASTSWDPLPRNRRRVYELQYPGG